MPLTLISNLVSRATQEHAGASSEVVKQKLFNDMHLAHQNLKLPCVGNFCPCSLSLFVCQNLTKIEHRINEWLDFCSFALVFQNCWTTPINFKMFVAQLVCQNDFQCESVWLMQFSKKFKKLGAGFGLCHHQNLKTCE